MALAWTITFAQPVAAQQTVWLVSSEKYVLVPNGTMRTTNGKGDSKISLSDGRRIVITAAGVVEVRNKRQQIVGRGHFVRWQGLSAGRIYIRSQDEQLKTRQGGPPRSVRQHTHLPTGSQALIFR